MVPDYSSTPVEPVQLLEEPVPLTEQVPTVSEATEVKSKSKKAVLTSVLSAIGLGATSLMGM